MRATPERHDRVMSLVQAMVHATHCTGRRVARVRRGTGGLMPYRSASFELDAAIAARILSLNPRSEDIQFGNPHAGGCSTACWRSCRDCATGGAWRRRGAHAVPRALPARTRGLRRPGAGREQPRLRARGYLLADLTGKRQPACTCPRIGRVRCALLHVFERHGVNLESIHSSRSLPASAFPHRFHARCRCVGTGGGRRDRCRWHRPGVAGRLSRAGRRIPNRRHGHGAGMRHDGRPRQERPPCPAFPPMPPRTPVRR